MNHFEWVTNKLKNKYDIFILESVAMYNSSKKLYKILFGK